VIVNHYEYEALDKRRVGLAAVTYGSAGARMFARGRVLAEAKPPRVEAVDGTAAGDAFAACLVVSHLEGRDWDESLRRACIAGALAASRPGAQSSLPTADEVDALL
jgi:ribokinase